MPFVYHANCLLDENLPERILDKYSFRITSHRTLPPFFNPCKNTRETKD
jgi:hypothetical protein